MIYSALYYLAVFVSEVLGHSPRWLEKCCANKKKGHLREHESAIDIDNIEMADIRDMGNSINKAELIAAQKELEDAEAAMQRLAQTNEDLVDVMRKQKQIGMQVNPMKMKKMGRGGRRKQKKKEFGAQKAGFEGDAAGLEGPKISSGGPAAADMAIAAAILTATASDQINPLSPPGRLNLQLTSVGKKGATHTRHVSADGKEYYSSIDRPGETSWSLPQDARVDGQDSGSGISGFGGSGGTKEVKRLSKVMKARRNSSRAKQEKIRSQDIPIKHPGMSKEVMSVKRKTFKKHQSGDGKAYFENVETGKTEWKLPEDAVVV